MEALTLMSPREAAASCPGWMLPLSMRTETSQHMGNQVGFPRSSSLTHTDLHLPGQIHLNGFHVSSPLRVLLSYSGLLGASSASCH